MAYYSRSLQKVVVVFKQSEIQKMYVICLRLKVCCITYPSIFPDRNFECNSILFVDTSFVIFIGRLHSNIIRAFSLN